MAKAGDDDSTAWPPDGLTLAEALPITLPEAWAACLAAVGEHARARGTAWRASRPFRIDDAIPLMRAFERAEAAFLVGLSNLVERGFHQLWARPNSLFEDARQVSPVAIKALTRLDALAGEAWGPGMALVDLRLRRRTSPVIAEAAPVDATTVPLPRPRTALIRGGQAMLTYRILRKLYPPAGLPPDEKSVEQVTAEIATELQSEQKAETAKNKTQKPLRAPGRDTVARVLRVLDWRVTSVLDLRVTP